MEWITRYSMIENNCDLSKRWIIFLTKNFWDYDAMFNIAGGLAYRKDQETFKRVGDDVIKAISTGKLIPKIEEMENLDKKYFRHLNIQNTKNKIEFILNIIKSPQDKKKFCYSILYDKFTLSQSMINQYEWSKNDDDFFTGFIDIVNAKTDFLLRFFQETAQKFNNGDFSLPALEKIKNLNKNFFLILNSLIDEKIKSKLSETILDSKKYSDSSFSIVDDVDTPEDSIVDISNYREPRYNEYKFREKE